MVLKIREYFCKKDKIKLIWYSGSDYIVCPKCGEYAYEVEK